MHAELQVLSPLVPVREVNFLRFCKQHAEGVWAVVDVSVDAIRDNSGAPTFVNCRRLPSGCVVQDMPNGYSKVSSVQMSLFQFLFVFLYVALKLYDFLLWYYAYLGRQPQSIRGLVAFTWLLFVCFIFIVVFPKWVFFPFGL